MQKDYEKYLGNFLHTKNIYITFDSSTNNIMFIRDTTKTLFQVMSDFDIADDPEQRWKDLRSGVYYYNEYAGTKHEFNSYILNLYWIYIKAI